jgi:hypothetical protein
MCSLLILVGSCLLLGTGFGGFSAAFVYGLTDEPPAVGSVAAQRLCMVQDWSITESSGLAISRRHAGCFWTHNDSGDGPRLFLVDAAGRTCGTLTVDTAAPVDWEDVCTFELDGESWLLIADVGDNAADRGRERRACRLLLVVEPGAGESVSAAQKRDWRGEVRAEIELTYPEGPRDCESVAVDVTSRMILLVSKRAAGKAALYGLPLELQTREQRGQLRELATMSIPYATGMDISVDGQSLVLVNPVSGLLYRRRFGEGWVEAVGRSPDILTLPLRKQGESVCFERDGKSVLVGSEGRWQAVWRVSLPEPVAEE